MASRKSIPKRLVPLWIAAALLLTAGWVARAQDTVPAEAADRPVAEAAARADQPESGVLDTAQAGLAPTEDVSAAQRSRLAQEQARGGTPLERATSFLGLLVFVAVAWLLSVNRAAVRWRVALWGMGLQFLFAVLIIVTPVGRPFFRFLNDIFVALLGYTNEGASFLFGNLIRPNVPVGPADGPFGAVADVGTWANTGALFAFSVLPTIIFFSSLMTLLYYLGIMQLFVRAFAWLMVRTMGTSGSESLSAAGNIFVGQTEAPLLVKPFVRTMTNSELHAVMTGGFATVAGGVMAAYVGMLVAFFPDIAGHLIAASVMSAPAALAVSKIMYPETEESVTRGEVKVELEKVDANVIDAAARGASEGLSLALNVGAMLLAFIALLALANGLVGWVGGTVRLRRPEHPGHPGRDRRAGGVADGNALAGRTAGGHAAGREDRAQRVRGLPAPGEHASGRRGAQRPLGGDRHVRAGGFANFSSIAIQIGGIGGLAPERRGDLSRLGLRAMIGGTLAAFMTACVVGILI
jgi:concentrative nucleoside transporter, CNT family